MAVTETSFDSTLAYTEFASSSDAAVSEMACLGSEARIDLCPRASTTTCNAANDGFVVLRCIPSEFAYRLAGLGASTTSGRLETRPSQYKLWGTVCSDGFDVLDLKVACTSLGLTFDSSSSFRVVYATEAVDDDTTPIRLSGLLCDSTHERLDRCPLNASVSCTHEQDVYINCGAAASVWEYRLADGPSSISGRLETRPNSSSPWGTICSLNFADADAFVACRALGFDLQSTVVTHTTATTARVRASSVSTAASRRFSSGFSLRALTRRPPPGSLPAPPPGTCRLAPLPAIRGSASATTR
jgi:deleted-in-malignant-brain-tumors protein 1